MGHRLIRKPYLQLHGKPILAHTISVFDNNPVVDSIFVIVNDSDLELCESMSIKPYGFRKVANLIPGGETRQDSVFNGLRLLPSDTDFVIVHDGVRPFVTGDLIDSCLEAVEEWGAAVAAVPVQDTIKVADTDGFIVDTPNRSKLWAVQTPQGFRRDVLMEAHQQARQTGLRATDDAALVEQLGRRIKLITGNHRNLKITTAEDLLIAEAFCTGENSKFADHIQLKNMRVGIGYDVHRLVENQKLVLGGVQIPYAKGLLGHSDADVLTHAVCDAILGAAGLGDIGVHFPDTDEAYADVNSLVLLKHVKTLVERDYSFLNVDSTIIAQRPKLAAYIPKMRQQLADTLSVPVDRINIKATTSEGLGFIGKEKAIAAQAIVSLDVRH